MNEQHSARPSEKRLQRGHVGPDEDWSTIDWVITLVLCAIVIGVLSWLMS